MLDWVAFSVDRHDLSTLSPAARSEAVRGYVEAASVRTFDLMRAPLVRVVTFRLDDRRWKLLVCTHHIILDGWSMGSCCRRC